VLRFRLMVNEVRIRGLKHQKEKREPWTILLDWT
jgi:hypothetical protein